MTEFAERLRSAREIQGMTQTDLAIKAGLIPSHISHFESGRREPNLENLIRIKQALNISYEMLLEPPTSEGAPQECKGDGWRPIETAPKDGTPFKAKRDNEEHVTWDTKGNWSYLDCTTEEEKIWHPTHWKRPYRLPSPPASTAGGNHE
jgi:transcriptional regulator with XRE-family HTH domain